jgi:hypothetical protein
MEITPHTMFVAAQGQLSCDLAGEAAILHLARGQYYGLNPVGARIWDLVQQPREVAELREALLREFEVEPEVCERDLAALLGELAARGLIERVDAPAR